MAEEARTPAELRFLAELDDLGQALGRLRAGLPADDHFTTESDLARSLLRQELARLANLRRRAGEEGAPADWGKRLSRRWRALEQIETLLDGQAAAPSPRVGGGSFISGRVTDAVTGLGIHEHRVELHSDFHSTRYEYTDVLGNYSFTDVEDGIYHLATESSQEYLGEVWDDIPCMGFCDPDLGTDVVVANGAVVAGIDFELDRAAKIIGRVIGADNGLGVDNVDIRVHDGNGYIVEWTDTDETGRYEAGGLEAATYYVLATPVSRYVPQLYQALPCSGCDPTTGTPVAVAENTVTADIDFVLELGGAIAGTVVDATTGAPLAGVGVAIDESGGGRADFVVTDGSGSYATEAGLVAGDYYVVAFPDDTHLPEVYDDVPCTVYGFCDSATGTPVPVAGPGTVGGIDFALDRAAIISGHTFDSDSGLPLSGVWIQAYDTGGTSRGSAFTSTSGLYEVGSLPGGTYHLLASEAGPHLDQLFDSMPCSFGDCVITDGTPVAAPVNAITGGIDFPLVRGGGISGTVVDALAGTPIADVDVRVYRTGSSALDVATTDGLGRFHTYVGLDTGDYFAVARPDFRDPHLPETWDDLSDAAEPWHGTPIPVVVGAVTPGIDFALDRGGTVSGTVLESGTALPIAGVRMRISKYNDSLNDWTDTDSLGRYEFAGLPPGTYFVTTDRVPVPFVRELFDDIPCEPHCNLETGTPIPVAANGTSPGIDFALLRGGLLAGRVVNALTGEPLSGVQMTIEGPGYFDTQYTPGNGGYSTTGLLPGQYFISAIRSGFHGQRYDGLSCEDSCDMHLATPIEILLAQIETRDFALYPSGQDPDLSISFEHLCGGSFTSCGEITLGPELQMVCNPEFTARDRVNFLGEVSIGSGAEIGTDPGLTCP